MQVVCVCVCVCAYKHACECQVLTQNIKEVAYCGDMDVLLRLHYHLETRSQRDWHQRFQA